MSDRNTQTVLIIREQGVQAYFVKSLFQLTAAPHAAVQLADQDVNSSSEHLI
jgi:hypothetical protein